MNSRKLTSLSGMAMLLMLVFANTAYTETLVRSFQLKEQFVPGRDGSAQVFVPDSPSPYIGAPSTAPFALNLWTELNWDSICGGSIFLGGGRMEGWTFNITAMDPALTADFSSVYAVVGGSFLNPTDGSSVQRFPCNSGPVNLEFGLAIVSIFQPQQQVTVPGLGTRVGFVLYSTDFSPEGQFYDLYQP